MDLANKKCVPCEAGTPPLTAEQVKEYQGQLSDNWEVIDGKRIKHEFKFKDFKEAMVFVNKVADTAEQEQHHPDIHIFYNRLTLELWTHAIDGMSENDFILAEKINLLSHGVTK